MKYRNNLYWVGPRLSDIRGLEYLFKGAVIIFGDKLNGDDFYSNAFCNSFDIRINHNDNKYNNYIGNHFEKEFDIIIKRDVNASFLWYKGTPSLNCSEEVRKRSVYFNSNYLDQLLSDKLKCRLLISNFVPAAGTKLMFGIDCDINNLKKLFPNYDEFILQEPIGSSGGFSTHILTEKNEKEILDKLMSKDLLVTPFYRKNIPINHHIVVYSNDVLVFPPSVQLIERIDDKLQYCGGDFICAQELDKRLQNKIFDQGKKIGTILQKLGYRGVLGIDYIILPDGEVLFLEINTRFQSSTLALNQALSDNNLPSIQEYHIESFYKDTPTILNKIKNVNYSIVSYLFSENNNALFLRDKILKSKEKCTIEYISDGVFENQILDKNAFLFRILIDSNVSSVFDSSVNHHPNIYSKRIDLNEDKTFKNLMRLKIGLLVHGVRVDERKVPDNFKKAVGSAFDLIIDNKLYINTYVNIKYSSLSPFSIDWISENKFKLTYNDKFIANVNIDYYDKYSTKKTQNNIEYSTIAQFFTDRLRIHPFPSCIYGISKANACKFCDLGNCTQTPNKYELDDIFEVIDFYVNSNLPIRHFLIGGGTSLGEKSWNVIIDIVKHIRLQTNRDIYLMSVPPPQDVLDKLYLAGVNEVGFNVEIFDRECAKKIMPQKGKIKINEYYKAFQYSIKLWGRDGNVRSLLMIGVEPLESTLAGVEELCKIGIMPILSLFRPLPNTPMENITPLNHEQVHDLWVKASLICKNYNFILGPTCVPCQNNTLSFPIDF